MTEQQNTSPQRGSLHPEWDVPQLNKLRAYDEVRQEVEHLRDLRIRPKRTSLRARGIETESNVGDDVIDLRALQFSSAGQVQVPGQGVLDMTSWARQQLGGELGVRWDKFFAHQEPHQIQSAVTNHLHARDTSEGGTLRKVIARRHDKGEEKASSVGDLRAFVSPSYAEIPDALLLDRMEHTIGRGRLNDMGFYQTGMTDRGTFMSLVYRDAINITGKTGEDEMAYYGLRLRNSDVGAFSLVGDGYLLRLICTNGMIMAVAEDRWLYRRHRQINEEQLGSLIDGMFEKLVDERGEIVTRNQRLLDTKVEHPAAEIRNFLRRNHRPKVEQDAAIRGFVEDAGLEMPEDENDLSPSNAYTILQGIARLGMAIRSNVERSHGIELLAGNYMRHALGNRTPALVA